MPIRNFEVVLELFQLVFVLEEMRGGPSPLTVKEAFRGRLAVNFELFLAA